MWVQYLKKFGLVIFVSFVILIFHFKYSFKVEIN